MIPVRCRLQHRDPARPETVLDLVPHEMVRLDSEHGRGYYRALLIVKRPDGYIDEIVYRER